MTYNLNVFDPTKHTEKWNSLPNSIKTRLKLLPESTILDSPKYNSASNQAYDNNKNLEFLRNHTPAPDYIPNPETDQWMWIGTYGGSQHMATYQNKSLIRLLYKHFIMPDLPDKRRLTTYSTTSIYDVNPYKISMSLSTRGSSRNTYNLRKALSQELPASPFERATLKVDVKELDKDSSQYREILNALNESGFMTMPNSKDMAIQYLIGEDAGFNPIHCKQIVEEYMK